MPGNGENSKGTSRDAHQLARDHCQEKQAAIDEAVAVAISKTTVEMMAKFTALLNERIATSMPVTLKTSSGATEISAIPPFDWTRDKTIYQWWQAWSKKARHALNAMEGDSNKAKISYFHHWIDTAGEAQVESWINNGFLLKKEDF